MWLASSNAEASYLLRRCEFEHAVASAEPLSIVGGHWGGLHAFMRTASTTQSPPFAEGCVLACTSFSFPMETRV
jgi:hypothetical protein